MTSVLLVVHIATAIIFIGALTASASIFPRFVDGQDPDHADQHHAVAVQMHRITNGYGRLAVITPVAGLALAIIGGKIGELWVLLAIVLSAVAGLVLIVRLIPAQKAALIAPSPEARRLCFSNAGLLNLVWIAILVLMITKPGGG
jgi:hypothetical protein